MNFQSTRFGTLEVQDDKVLDFPKGLIGFSGLTRWTLLSEGEDALFMWLHSVEDPDIALPVANPLNFYPDFSYRVSGDDLAALGRGDGDLAGLDLLAVVTVTESVDSCTINLRAPVLLDQDARRAVQAVNQAGDLDVRAPLWANVRLDDLQAKEG